MAQKTAQEIRELSSREAKAWRVIDQYLITKSRKDGAKIPAVVKLAAAEFILKRLYPEKRVVAGSGEEGEFIIKIEKGNPDANGNNLPVARFTIPSIQ